MSASIYFTYSSDVKTTKKYNQRFSVFRLQRGIISKKSEALAEVLSLSFAERHHFQEVGGSGRGSQSFVCLTLFPRSTTRGSESFVCREESLPLQLEVQSLKLERTCLSP
ncbi:hypothetical protein BgiBS90_000753 [Biomphalaria glabrata]|nr:hypothetical protein BgiBS90_000753 [Biomphalaria glabrata]